MEEKQSKNSPILIIAVIMLTIAVIVLAAALLYKHPLKEDKNPDAETKEEVSNDNDGQADTKVEAEESLEEIEERPEEKPTTETASKDLKLKYKDCYNSNAFLSFENGIDGKCESLKENETKTYTVKANGKNMTLKIKAYSEGEFNGPTPATEIYINNKKVTKGNMAIEAIYQLDDVFIIQERVSEGCMARYISIYNMNGTNIFKVSDGQELLDINKATGKITYVHSYSLDCVASNKDYKASVTYKNGTLSKEVKE